MILRDDADTQELMALPDVAGTRGLDANVLADLRELIDALDRRVPQSRREGEHRITQDAALLRRQAEERIAEIEAILPASVPSLILNQTD
jgi:hypothetical protein